MSRSISAQQRLFIEFIELRREVGAESAKRSELAALLFTGLLHGRLTA